MEGSATKTLRTLLEQMQSDPAVTVMANKTPPKSSAEAFPTFLYKIAPILSVQESPSMVQSSSSPQNTSTTIVTTIPPNVTSPGATMVLEDMGLRRTRTVIPNSVKVQIAKVANQIPRMTQGEIAQMFGIDRTTVSKILKRRREYLDLGPEPEAPKAKYLCRKYCVLPAGGNKIPKQTQVPSQQPEDPIEIKEEITEIDDTEALSREMNNLDKFRDQQKMIEEANKQRKALLSKTLTERQKKAREEAQKLSHIQKEVQLLDNRLSADVTLIRSRIESASKDYMEAQRRYDRAEREFIEAKMDLQKKSDLKEQLTEHLYTIIHQNELRKAEKLSQLMNELHVEMETEEEGVKLATLPPLSAFNSVSLPALQRGRSQDSSQNGAPSTKESNHKSTQSSENTAINSTTGHIEETKNSTVHLPAAESHNKDKVVNNSNCAKGEQSVNKSSVRLQTSVQQGTSETKLDGKINTDKPVPTSWTLDVIIKQEPEDVD
ncbi:uncharacterized protein LOC134270361 [Saccostrea cucullata]|uniref:uncharacterized protein LOC134270361 n=1 Tax=Saccostrea cuccullata TaxID=36930 RepID=UPI002ED49C42